VPRFLGLTGVIPFIALAPPVSKHLFWVLPHDVIDNSAMFQVRAPRPRRRAAPWRVHSPPCRQRCRGGPADAPLLWRTPPLGRRQVGYGISILTFLGAVHWGLAMGSAAMASPLMARAARESYL
jgi:hypothetical protein